MLISSGRSPKSELPHLIRTPLLKAALWLKPRQGSIRYFGNAHHFFIDIRYRME